LAEREEGRLQQQREDQMATPKLPNSVAPKKCST
jgi:hypothetical protein